MESKVNMDSGCRGHVRHSGCRGKAKSTWTQHGLRLQREGKANMDSGLKVSTGAMHLTWTLNGDVHRWIKTEGEMDDTWIQDAMQMQSAVNEGAVNVHG
eukprot:7235626-Lingulodinium_polyedra.AAC.1